MSVIDEVKQKTDIAEIVGQYVTLRKSGRNLSAPCPFHSEKHPSFFVYPEQQSWHCFGACNTGGDVFSFLMKKEGYDFGEALRVLAERAGVELPSYRREDQHREEKDVYFRMNEAAAVWFHNNLLNAPAAEKARQYVARRGYSQQTVTDFTLGYAPNEWEALKKYLLEKEFEEKDLVTGGLLYQNEDGRTTDRFRGKLIIPIRDARGRVTGFGARVLDDSLPKYVNSPQTPTFDKSATLYAIDRAAATIRKQERAVIMEGYMDVLTAHQHGVTNAVASMGTAITETQVNILKRMTKNLVLAMDADAAGEEAMLRTVGHENLLGAEIKVVVLPEGQDPDDVIKSGVAAWQELIGKAVPLLDFLFQKTTENLDLSKAGDKSKAAEKLVPVLRNLNDRVRQTHYFQLLARLLNVDVPTLMSLRSARPAPVRRAAAPASNAFNRKVAGKSALEDYLLALLMANPVLRGHAEAPEPAFFSRSDNREIFRVLRSIDAPGDTTVEVLKDALEPALHEHVDEIAARVLPVTKNAAELKYVDCLYRLKDNYLKTLLASRAASHGAAGEEDEEDSEAFIRENVNYTAGRKEVDTHRKNNRSGSRR
jgi:DNA primase